MVLSVDPKRKPLHPASNANPQAWDGSGLSPERDRSMATQFGRDGFLHLSGNFLHRNIFDGLLGAIDALELKGVVDPNSTKLQNLNDAIYLDEAFLEFARHPSLISLLENLLGSQVELQHSKMMNKYPAQGASSSVKWHQDTPFYPHTNDDLISVGLHFDDETDDSGPLQFIAGSHKLGIFSHADEATGEFLYEINDPDFEPQDKTPTVVKCSPGDITLHHGNVIHASTPSKGQRRRVLYLQYRAIDAFQLAGVVWRSSGFSPYPEPPPKRYARFRDGTRLEVRSNGRLFDVSGTLAPDNKKTRSVND